MSAVGVVPLRVAEVCVGKARDKNLAICGVGHASTYSYYCDRKDRWCSDSTSDMTPFNGLEILRIARVPAVVCARENEKIGANR